MKIEDILLENDTLKEVDGLKPEERLGARFGNWLKDKLTSGPETKADARAERLERRRAQVDAEKRAEARRGEDWLADTPGELADLLAQQGGAWSPDAKGTYPEFPELKKAPTPVDQEGGVAQGVSDIDDTDTAEPIIPSDTAGMAGTGKTPAVAKTDKETFGGDPSVMRDTVKIGQPERARGARGKNMTRTDAEAQAAAKFKKPVDPKYPYTAPDGRRLKYPHGDIRNLGKYFKPANVTNQGGKKMAGDVEPQKKGTDLRNLLKLAGVNRPDGSAKDNK